MIMVNTKRSNDIWTISSILNWTINYFKSKQIESARLDAEVLLAHVLKQERIYLYVHFDEPMEQDELAQFRQYVAKRARHIPVAYIIGKREFMGLSFKVTPDTLIPRPDTEILVESALDNIDKDAAVNIADIGTGSGAIILSLLKNRDKARGFTVDISAKAIDVAKENAQKLAVDDRCEFFTGDLFAPLNARKSFFEAIVSNPPYIPREDIATLESDVKDYEPLSALTDNGDGLSFYRRLFAEGKMYLTDNGFMAVEIGIHQAEAVKKIAEANDWHKIKIIKDYAGIDRVVMAWKQN